MCLRTTSTKYLFALFLAGSSWGDPAFFVDSDHNADLQYHDSHTHISHYASLWRTGENSASQSMAVELQQNSWNGKYNGQRMVHVWENDPEMALLLGKCGNDYDLQGRIRFTNPDDFGAAAHAGVNYKEWIFGLEGAASQTTLLNFAWADQAFPKGHEKIAGQWLTEWRSANLTAAHEWKRSRLEGMLSLHYSQPRAVRDLYGVQDSSLWDRGQLKGSQQLQHWQISSGIGSESGSLSILGVRKAIPNTEIQFFQTRILCDQNEAWIHLSRREQGAVEYEGWGSQLLPPFLSWERPYAPSAPQVAGATFAYQRLDFHLAPSSPGQVTFKGVRMFPPNLTSLLGYSLFQKSVQFSGRARLHQFNLQLALPYVRGAWTCWLAGRATAWNGYATVGQATYTAGIFGDLESAWTKEYSVLAGLADVSSGVAYRWTTHPSLRASIECGQSIPWLVRLQENNKPLALPASPASDGASYWIPNGLRIGIQLHYIR